jgi:hypothetical protein
MPEVKVPDSTSLMQSLLSLAWAVEARDPYTGGHLWRVAQFSMILARSIGCLRIEVARIGLGGFLHDLGKIGIPDSILNKPDKLTDEEYAVIKTHPRIGADLLATHPLNAITHNAVFLHHETPDGRGYPGGLKLDQIPLEARIIGLTDAFDAMTSTRPYRKGMPLAKALDIIAANLGTQFDKPLGEELIKIAKQGALDSIIGHTEPRIPLQICGMCGPTIMVTREHKDGDMVFCRSCGAGANLHRTAAGISISPSDKKGSADQLAAVPDTGLLQELVDTQFVEAMTGQTSSLADESFFSRLFGSSSKSGSFSKKF